mmetsp:Transcript_9389/g.10928  ORF Transcript_9389/g.10928 Transcript_9389/m.10928 type:complete len:238 (+) Transcript_9389:28-741(+)
MKSIVYLLILQIISIVSAFTLQQPRSLTKTTLRSSPSSIEELLESDKWAIIKEELDHVPVFSCANEQGQPLQYNVGGGPIAFFFCDIDAANKELEKAKLETKLPGLTLLPFPLGEVFQMGAKQMGVIIPSAEALEGAGAPEGLNPIGQQVPLFGCMEIQADKADGTSMTPLFFTKGEAEEAMNMALEGAGASGDDSKFQVSIMPLVKAVQQMSTNENQSFIFEAPKSSLEYLRNFMK